MADAVVERCPEVGRELLLLAQRGQQRDRDAAARLAVEARPAPDLAPRKTREELLKFCCDGRSAREGPVDVGVAHNLAANLEAAFELFVWHCSTSWCRSNRPRRKQFR